MMLFTFIVCASSLSPPVFSPSFFPLFPTLGRFYLFCFLAAIALGPAWSSEPGGAMAPVPRCFSDPFLGRVSWERACSLGGRGRQSSMCKACGGLEPQGRIELLMDKAHTRMYVFVCVYVCVCLSVLGGAPKIYSLSKKSEYNIVLLTRVFIMYVIFLDVLILCICVFASFHVHLPVFFYPHPRKPRFYSLFLRIQHFFRFTSKKKG